MDQVTLTGSIFELIHYVYLADGDGGSDWRAACMPGMTEFHETPYHKSVPRTNDVRAATCPACKRTAVFKKDLERLESYLKKVIANGK